MLHRPPGVPLLHPGPCGPPLRRRSRHARQPPARLLEVQQPEGHPPPAHLPRLMSATPHLDAVQATHRTIAFRPALVDITGDVVSGLVLSQLLYWTPRATVEREGHRWIVKAASDWWAEVRVTVKQARRAIDVLAEAGLVERNIWKWNGAPTTHMRIVPEALEAALVKLVAGPDGGGE